MATTMLYLEPYTLHALLSLSRVAVEAQLGHCGISKERREISVWRMCMGCGCDGLWDEWCVCGEIGLGLWLMLMR